MRRLTGMTVDATTCDSRGDSGMVFDWVFIQPLLVLVDMTAHQRDEQVANAGRAHLAQCRELLGISTIEQQDAATNHPAFVYWLECPRCGHPLGMHHNFEVAGLHFFRAALEDHTAAVNEHDIG